MNDPYDRADDVPPDLYRDENGQLPAEGVDWLYCFLGALVYTGLILATIALAPLR